MVQVIEPLPPTIGGSEAILDSWIQPGSTTVTVATLQSETGNERCLFLCHSFKSINLSVLNQRFKCFGLKTSTSDLEKII